MSHITLDNVSIEFPLYGGGSRSLKRAVMNVGSRGRIACDAHDRVCVRALRDISLAIKNKERLGLVGVNGAGKSTLLRVLAGIYEPTEGRVHCKGRVVPLFDPQLGMDPEATGYENITLRGLLLGLSTREIRQHVDDIAEFTELGDHLDMAARTYSTGMLMRLAFAISTCVEPEILLLDEWVGTGDVRFLKKAEKRLNDFVGRSNVLVLASHSAGLIRRMCNKAILLEEGRIKAVGPVDEVLAAHEGQGATGPAVA